MSILTEADLAELRALEEGEMLDTLVFSSVVMAKNVTTGFEDPTTTVLFTTPGKVAGRGGSQGAEAQPRAVTIGGVERLVIQSGIKIPVSAPAIPTGVVVQAEVIAVGSGTDPSLLGQVFQLVGYGGKSGATARRLDVVEV